MSFASLPFILHAEITALEEKEKEYEEKLHIIMEELLLQENRQRDLEPQLSELEKVEWDNVLDGEKKCELDLTLKVASYKAMILECEQKLEDVRSKESELLNELKKEEENIAQERERLKAEEARAREEEEKTSTEIAKLQAEFLDVQKRAAECEASLSRVNGELESVEEDLGEKTNELVALEASLKDENLRDFVAHPVPKEDPKPKDSGEGESDFAFCLLLCVKRNNSRSHLPLSVCSH